MVKYASKLDSNGIPLLSKEQLERHGERILYAFSPAVLMSPQPTDLDGLISSMGFNLEYQYLSHNGVYLGLTVFDDTDMLPVYNPVLNRAEFISVKKNTIIIEGTLAENPAYEHRERFTLGHEAAHGLLHAEYFQRKAEFAGYSDTSGGIYAKPSFPDLSGVDVNGRRLQGEAWLEWQANYLAAVLLMPKAAIKKLRNQIGPEMGGYWHIELINKMITVFNVSEQAARVRLASLGYLPT
jgi:hypothetical protein